MSRDKRGVVNPVVPGSSPGATAKFVICCENDDIVTGCPNAFGSLRENVGPEKRRMDVRRRRVSVSTSGAVAYANALMRAAASACHTCCRATYRAALGRALRTPERSQEHTAPRRQESTTARAGATDHTASFAQISFTSGSYREASGSSLARLTGVPKLS